ncbi:MAG: protein of unknown function [Leptospirillum rubarum]|nr:MAG: protein of unknown function [Leptospirillum rubarum]
MLSETRILWRGILVGGLLFGTGWVGLAMAHPGGVSPPVHPAVHPAAHPNPHGAVNLGMTHMSPTSANFGQEVSGVATTQGKEISKDAQSGMTGQKLSDVARQHGDTVSDVATGSQLPAPGATPPPPPPGSAPAPPPAP